MFVCVYIYIWVNYNISLTWIKAIWGWFPLLTMIPVRSQWGCYNLPRYMIYAYVFYILATYDTIHSTYLLPIHCLHTTYITWLQIDRHYMHTNVLHKYYHIAPMYHLYIWMHQLLYIYTPYSRCNPLPSQTKKNTRSPGDPLDDTSPWCRSRSSWLISARDGMTCSPWLRMIYIYI